MSGKKSKILADLRSLVLFPKGRARPQGLTAEQWNAVSRKQGNMAKRITCSDCHWRVVHFNDGTRELAYLTARKGVVYRGLILRKELPYWAVRRVTTAF